MARIDNLTNFLTDVADAIRTKKETDEDILASEFDTEILSIETGIDTSDADVTSGDIVQGKVAYGPNGKVIGSYEPAMTQEEYNEALIVTNQIKGGSE